MDIRNCRKCGKLYAYTKKPICPDCEKLDEEDLNRVRDFIKENPGIRLSAVSEELEISMNQIMRYIRDKQIELTDGMDIELQCEDCGRPITTGRKCKKCNERMSKNLESSISQPSRKFEPNNSQGGSKKDLGSGMVGL